MVDVIPSDTAFELHGNWLMLNVTKGRSSGDSSLSFDLVLTCCCTHRGDSEMQSGVGHDFTLK